MQEINYDPDYNLSVNLSKDDRQLLGELLWDGISQAASAENAERVAELLAVIKKLNSAQIIP